MHAMRVQSDAVGQADAAASYALTLVQAWGPVELVGGELRAGDVTLNGDTELVDAVKDRFGFGCTIFQGNVRVGTTAVAAGGRRARAGDRGEHRDSTPVAGGWA